MNTPATAIMHPTAHATAAADVVDATPDWGAMSRELLAEKLSAAYWRGPVSLHAMAPATRADWLRVVDVAIAELQGTPAS